MYTDTLCGLLTSLRRGGEHHSIKWIQFGYVRLQKLWQIPAWGYTIMIYHALQVPTDSTSLVGNPPIRVSYNCFSILCLRELNKGLLVAYLESIPMCAQCQECKTPNGASTTLNSRRIVCFQHLSLKVRCCIRRSAKRRFLVRQSLNWSVRLTRTTMS